VATSSSNGFRIAQSVTCSPYSCHATGTETLAVWGGGGGWITQLLSTFSLYSKPEGACYREDRNVGACGQNFLLLEHCFSVSLARPHTFNFW